MASMARPKPGSHPEPPADLPARSLPLKESKGPWIRIHACGRAAVFFGRTGDNRFDAPDGAYGVLYAAQDVFCAFIETFGDPLDVRLVSRADLAKRCLASISSTRRLRLVDLTGEGLRQIGADARLASGDRALAQRWAQALWRHPLKPDGIAYRPRHDPSKEAVAIFDRAKPAVKSQPIGRLTGDPATLARILDHYGFALT